MRSISILVALVICVEATAQELKIVNIRVGQGDATLIQGPKEADGSRINVLFDAGNVKARDAGNILRKVLDRYGVDKLDHVIVSHDDQDHMGGIVFGKIAGTNFSHGSSFVLGFDNAPGCEGVDDNGDGVTDWVSGKENYIPAPGELGECDDMKVLNWVDYGEANMRNKHHIRKYNGMANAMGTRKELDSQTKVDSYEIDLGNKAVMKPYASHGFVRGRTTGPVPNVTSPNEKSLSFLVSYKKFDFLISGDLIGKGKGNDKRIDAKMEQAVGKAIARDNVIVDVLHVNHHGADNGSAKEFLDDIKPNIAIISAGNENGFSHPRNSVLGRLHEANTYRTILTSFGESRTRISSKTRDRVAVYQNDIIITSDGDTYDVSTSRSFHSDINCVEKPSRCSRGL